MFPNYPDSNLLKRGLPYFPNNDYRYQHAFQTAVLQFHRAARLQHCDDAEKKVLLRGGGDLGRTRLDDLLHWGQFPSLLGHLNLLSLERN